MNYVTVEEKTITVIQINEDLELLIFCQDKILCQSLIQFVF